MPRSGEKKKKKKTPFEEGPFFAQRVFEPPSHSHTYTQSHTHTHTTMDITTIAVLGGVAAASVAMVKLCGPKAEPELEAPQPELNGKAVRTPLVLL